MSNRIANRNYKDSLFRKIFGENKENALSLYNAVNGSNYTNADDLEYTTLEDVVYMKMKNDMSFLFGTSLNLYEHQSTYNPNMPLRGFLYFADLYRKLIDDNEKIYTQKVVKIPNPQYIVFYNGPISDMNENMRKLKLSDCFERPDKSGEFEWTATMVNINLEFNAELFQKCRILEEYSIVIRRVKDYNQRGMSLSDAISRTVDECIEENILRDILEMQKKEAVNMVLTEFNEERYEQLIREETAFKTTYAFLAKKIVTLEQAAEGLGITVEEFLQEIKDYGLELPE